MNRLVLMVGAPLAFGAVASLAYASSGLFDLMRIGASYKAKILCSEVFVAGRAPENVLLSEFEGFGSPLARAIVASADQNAQVATASGPFGLGRARAVFREGVGCTIVNSPLAQLRRPFVGGAPAPTRRPRSAIDQQPVDARPPVDRSALVSAIDKAFAEWSAGHRGLVVTIGGDVVAERYAEGFEAQTPFRSWSMAKSIVATLVGAAAADGHIDLYAPVNAPEWVGDPVRSRITWNDLLRMQSGLAFNEDYSRLNSDVQRMLSTAPDAAALAARQEAIYQPGAHWAYSSGSTNIIMRALESALRAAGVNPVSYPHDRIFGPLGATSFVLERDAAGVFIGSSFAYATARDWARLGQLYLNDGVWNGRRLLPEGWRAYVTAATPASGGVYGAHFWLNGVEAETGKQFLPGLPTDIFFMSGYEGQFVFVIPSVDMVIVRTGITRGRDVWPVIRPVVEAAYEAAGAGRRRALPPLSAASAETR